MANESQRHGGLLAKGLLCDVMKITRKKNKTPLSTGIWQALKLIFGFLGQLNSS